MSGENLVDAQPSIQNQRNEPTVSFTLEFSLVSSFLPSSLNAALVALSIEPCKLSKAFYIATFPIGTGDS